MQNLINATEDEMDRAIVREQRKNQECVGETEMSENLRLLLQSFADSVGEIYSFPMMLEGFPRIAETAGYVEIIHPPGHHGVQKYRMTAAGRKALAVANAELGDRATRYVHRLKEFGMNTKPLVFGYPILVPLSQPVKYHDGTIVEDRSAIGKVKASLTCIFSRRKLLSE